MYGAKVQELFSVLFAGLSLVNLSKSNICILVKFLLLKWVYLLRFRMCDHIHISAEGNNLYTCR